MNSSLQKLRFNPLAVAFIMLSIAVIYFASRFPDEGQVGPGFFPIAISVGIILFAVIDLLVDDSTELRLSEYEMTEAGITLVLVVAYVALMPVTGFLVGTMAFLPVIMYFSGIRSKVTIVTVSFFLPIFLFYIFSQVFLIRLPEGVIPFSRLLPRLPLVVVL